MDNKKNTATLNLAFEKEEKEKRIAELILANKELAFRKKEKEKLAGSLLIANKELAFQHSENEKKAAECTICTDKLTKTEKLFQLMVNNIKDYAIIHLDAEGCVATWNSGAQYIKGYTEEDVIGKPISIFYTPEEIAAGKPKRDLQLALQHGRFETEGLCVKKDGSTFYANIVYTAIVDGQGLHKEYLKITKDITKLKEAEEKLKKINDELEQRVVERTEKLARSEAFNLGVLNSLAPHIAVLNKSGNIVAVNESWKNFAIKNGKTSLFGTAVGTNYYAVCEKASKDNTKEAGEVARGIQGIMDETIANFYLEYEFHSPTERQWFAIGITKFESDEPMVVITHTNITERKKTENLLAERENYLRTILETEPACVKILDFNGKLLSINPAGLAMVEADSEAQVLNTPMVDLVNYGYKTSFNKLISSVFDGNSGKLEFEITGFKGGHLWMETQAVPMKNDGQVVSFLGVTQDITERKKAETIIKESEAKYRDLIEQAVDGIVILNQQGKLLQLNGSFLKMLGYDKSEITNMTIRDLIPKEETENQVKELKKMLAGETRFYERVFKRKDGTTFIAEVNGQITQNGLLVAFLRDITNRKNAEDEIVKTNTQLRELTAHLQNVREEERQRIAREIQGHQQDFAN
jgi:PAS domain S-box-containing protein